MVNFSRASIAVLLLSALLAAQPAAATTWVEVKVRDPVSGRTVEVHEPASYGSYIYSWPGKEDQVFWPFTDDAWLRFNPRSGYGAFGEDFENLEGEAVERVKTWLAAHYDRKKPPRTRLAKLAWLEKLYELRGVDDDFRCFYYRLMAFETSEADPAASLDYVRKAMPLLERQLVDASDADERLPVLYLLGEYHRRLGDAVLARDFFDQARAVTYRDEEGVEHVGSEYFNQLIEEREALGMDEASGK
jgi:hypothetical protein